MFKEFLIKLKTPDNEAIIEAIHQGYKACFEILMNICLVMAT